MWRGRAGEGGREKKESAAPVEKWVRVPFVESSVTGESLAGPRLRPSPGHIMNPMRACMHTTGISQ